MKLEEAINKYFYKDNLINCISKYQLYYQIGLGGVVFKSTQDIEETYKKLEELNLQINTQTVFESIHKIVLHLSQEDDFDNKFDSHLRMSALAQMLNDFVEADNDLIDAQPFADMIFEQIKDDTFFNEYMQEQFDDDYDNVFLIWESTITDEIAKNVKDVVTEIFDQK